MSCEVLPTHTPALFREAVERAAEHLRRDEVVALPTETVYGLAANALSPEAVAKIYRIKERPEHNPVIVHVCDLAMARRCVSDWTSAAQQLAGAFWPGPLTLVLPRSSQIPDIVTAGGNTVGVRLPGHPLMREVIRACDFPLAAPSANRSNELSPTNAGHVHDALGTRLQLIIDGGQAQVGIESTVIDLSAGAPVVLRPGIIPDESLAAVVGKLGLAGGRPGEPLRSPGNLPRHYAPRGKLILLQWTSDADLIHKLDPAVHRAQATLICHTQIPSPAGWHGVHVVPHDAEAYARALYAELHRCDREGVRWIVVEAVPDTAAWRGIADRLKRASADGNE